MKLMNRVGMFLMVALGLLLASNVLAQGGGGQGGGQGRQQRDPAEMRKMMTDRMKENMEATDDEWKVIEPLLSKVMEKQMGSAMGRMGGMRMMGGGRQGGQGGQGGPGMDRPVDTSNPVAVATDELRKALESKDTPAATLKAKMDALREAQKKGEADLKAAREELRKALTARQEAQLVLMGQLD